MNIPCNAAHIARNILEAPSSPKPYTEEELDGILKAYHERMRKDMHDKVQFKLTATVLYMYTEKKAETSMDLNAWVREFEDEIVQALLKGGFKVVRGEEKILISVPPAEKNLS